MEENFEINAISDSLSRILSPMNFPSDVYKWMKINAKPKMALKLMQVCKYFQHSDGFPYLVVKHVSGDKCGWCLETLDGKIIKTKNVETISKKLWIVREILINFFCEGVSILLSKTVVCNIQKIILFDQQITLDEFKFLTDGGMIEECTLIQTTIVSENGEMVPLEDIFECLPNARKINSRSKAPSFFSLKNAEIKMSTKLEKLILYISPTNFDIHKLFDYMKSHQKVQYTLWLCEISTEEFAKNIAPSFNKMLQEWSSVFAEPDVVRYPKN